MAIEIDELLLRTWPLPQPRHDDDKEARGHALVIAGSAEIPGAAVLAGIAALHAGAGKLTIATSASAAPWVAQSVPEARVIAIPTDGEKDKELPDLPAGIDSVLIGPGMLDNEQTIAIVKAAFDAYPDKYFVLDAAAMSAVKTFAFNNRVLITPHAGEMATLLECDKRYVVQNSAKVALRAAEQWHIAVALKGAETHIALPDQRAWIHRGGDVGLATSGSGDVLAGAIVGLLAQGASLEQAAAWGITLHALAGEAAAREAGHTIGYTAREISAHIPRVRGALSQNRAYNENQ